MPRKEPQQSSTPSFETEFERLTSIVDKLEAGNVPLAEMLTLYEEAMTLSGKLRETLAEAELRVERLAPIHEEAFPKEIEAEEIEIAELRGTVPDTSTDEDSLF